MLLEAIAKVATLLTLKGLRDKPEIVITLAILAVIVWIIYTKMNYIRGIKLIGVWLVLYVLSSIFQAFFWNS